MGVMNSVLDMLRWRRLGKHSRYEDRDLSQKYGLGVHQGRDGDQRQEARLRQSRGHMENVQEDPMDPQQLRRRDPPPDWKGAAVKWKGNQETEVSSQEKKVFQGGSGQQCPMLPKRSNKIRSEKWHSIW